MTMDYQSILSNKPIEHQDYPFNSIEFFDDQSVKEKLYIDKSKMEANANDQLEEIVDNYLDDHPDIEKAVAYREEGPESRFAFREFGRN